jgi:hypothetical protein
MYFSLIVFQLRLRNLALLTQADMSWHNTKEDNAMDSEADNTAAQS